MKPEGADPSLKCPVDPQTRELWLKAAKAKGKTPPHPPVAPPAQQAPRRFNLDSGRWTTLPTHTTRPAPSSPTKPKMYSLSTDREISTIPRALPSASDPPLNSAVRAAAPPLANSQAETGHDASTGNWIYPSPQQFFEAMKRKNHPANPEDMATVVPIHNAVNERTWGHILDWERTRSSPQSCPGGPKLVSFSGDSKKLTPKAWWMSLLGYERPFDRHDWVVDRCGTRVEYVIDFYRGKEGGRDGKVSFYLDVRPKVNTVEGIMMRVGRWAGIGRRS